MSNKPRKRNQFEDPAAARAALELNKYVLSWQQWLKEGVWLKRATQIIAAENDFVWGRMLRSLRIVRVRLLGDGYGNTAIMQLVNIALAPFDTQPATVCSEQESSEAVEDGKVHGKLIEFVTANIMQRLDDSHLFSNDELQRIREIYVSGLAPVGRQIDYLHAVLDLHCDDATKAAIALFEEKVPEKEAQRDGG